MGKAKGIVVKPIAAKDAIALVKRLHYSGKVAMNSQLHLGVFMDGRCGGVMQFGPSLRKRAMLPLVDGALWNDFIELNRLAFADWLPRNSESRALGYAFRWMRKQYPHIKWCVSFADATQCGDGTIYRASGFVLTGIANSPSVLLLPDGRTVHKVGLFTNPNTPRKELGGKTIAQAMGGQCSLSKYAALSGGRLLKGFQLRYIYFLDPEARKRLTVPVLPFSEIQRLGAGMYRGKPSAGSSSVEHLASSGEVGGSIPTPALNSSKV